MRSVKPTDNEGHRGTADILLPMGCTLFHIEVNFNACLFNDSLVVLLQFVGSICETLNFPGGYSSTASRFCQYVGSRHGV